ncbi:MAG TPA: winged helix-turn-helix transcriptional regulator [bacterium]|nr:winged helix-turn-helix transcriptional regulator [bacterium]
MLKKPNHTQIPNDFIEESMKLLNGGSVKVFLCICRKTIGWHKDTDQISYSQLMEMVGMSTRSIKSAIDELEEKGLIVTVKEGGKATTYEVNFETTVKSKEVKFALEGETTVESKEDLFKKESSTSLKSKETKETLKETLQKKEDISTKPIIQKPAPVKKHKKEKPFEEMTPYQKVVDTYWNCFKTATGNEPLINGTTGKHVKMLLKQPLDQVLTVIKKYFETSFWFNENKQYDFKQITCHYNLILSAAGKKKTGNSWYEINKKQIDANFPGVN